MLQNVIRIEYVTSNKTMTYNHDYGFVFVYVNSDHRIEYRNIITR